MLKYDCNYFNGDRPCVNNKLNGITCDICEIYKPIAFKILIIKLDALGDVLRTTSILKPLKDKYPESRISWCTRENAKDLFQNNPYVDEVLILNSELNFRLNTEEFDLIINLDNSKISSSIASSAVSKNKIGFLMDKRGFIVPTSDEADYWLHMGAFDNIKRQNKLTYQEIIYSILDLSKPISRPVFILPSEQKYQAKYLISKFELDPLKKTVGLNIGVGSKWPSKGWSVNRWKEIITLLSKIKLNILLLGGPEEKLKNSELKKQYDFLIDTGCENNLIEFSAIINLCDVLVTADTLALHIGTALSKNIVGLFGPTSITEIDLYGMGKILHSGKECKCYYKRTCSESTSCVDNITAYEVFTEIKHYI